MTALIFTLTFIAILILSTIFFTLVIFGAWNLALVPLLNLPPIEIVTAFGIALVFSIIRGLFSK